MAVYCTDMVGGALSVAAFREVALPYLACSQDENWFTLGVGGGWGLLVYHSTHLTLLLFIYIIVCFLF